MPTQFSTSMPSLELHTHGCAASEPARSSTEGGRQPLANGVGASMQLGVARTHSDAGCVRTPSGLTEELFDAGLAAWADGKHGVLSCYTSNSPHAAADALTCQADAEGSQPGPRALFRDEV